MANKRLSRGAKTGIAITCIAVILLGAIAFLNMPGKGADGQVDSIIESSSASSVSPGSASSGGLSSASPSPSATASSGKKDDVYGALKSAYYSDSGNSLGNLYSVEACRADDGTMVVKISESKAHSDPTEVGEYRVADDLLDRIEAIVDSAGMKVFLKDTMTLRRHTALASQTRWADRQTADACCALLRSMWVTGRRGTVPFLSD